MRINAYILAADPAWIEASVLSYYDIVDEIVVSYDESGTGWTGVPISVDECLHRLAAIDSHKKMRFMPGHYARLDHPPMENETYQRQCALNDAGNGADWVLQLDTDEILPDPLQFVARLNADIPTHIEAVDWPMRTFFQRTSSGRLLEVCTLLRKQVSSYPGSIVVRSGTQLRHARQTHASNWRYDIRPRDTDPATNNQRVHAVVPEAEAILHLSWLRTEAAICSKLESWGHSGDFDWKRYLERTWKAAPTTWWKTFNFHPFCPRWWPALRPVDVSSHLVYSGE